MLIVPSERRLDWRRPPWVTLFLIATCTLVFLGYQLGDDRRAMQAVEFYVESGLIEYEEAYLEEYLDAEYGQVLPGDAEPDPSWLASLAIQPGFDQVIREAWQQEEPLSDWRISREQFEKQRDELSWIRFGLAPASFEPVQLFSHMFMHGGFAHLLGNMVFLFLFGIALERVIGATAFVAVYFLTGLSSVGLFILMNAGSHAPLVGASGAISGLMGAFLGVYGMRKMKFFYSIGFWFGEFTAPALVVFPLWMLKELYGYYFTDTQVAYMAHAGGLLGGLLVGMLLRGGSTETIDNDEAEKAEQAKRQQRLTRIQALLTDLRVDEARQLAEKSIQETPSESEYWNMYRLVAERTPRGGDYDRIIATIFLNAGKKAMTPHFLLQVLEEYRRKTEGNLSVLRSRAGAMLVHRFYREGRTSDVDKLLELVVGAGNSGAELTKLLRQLLDYAEKNRDRRRIERYRKYLETAGA